MNTSDTGITIITGLRNSLLDLGYISIYPVNTCFWCCYLFCFFSKSYRLNPSSGCFKRGRFWSGSLALGDSFLTSSSVLYIWRMPGQFISFSTSVFISASRAWILELKRGLSLNLHPFHRCSCCSRSFLGDLSSWLLPQCSIVSLQLQPVSAGVLYQPSPFNLLRRCSASWKPFLLLPLLWAFSSAFAKASTLCFRLHGCIISASKLCCWR